MMQLLGPWDQHDRDDRRIMVIGEAWNMERDGIFSIDAKGGVMH